MRPATKTSDPVALIDRLDAGAIRTELDALYEREAVLRAALKIARTRERAQLRQRAAAREEVRRAR